MSCKYLTSSLFIKAFLFSTFLFVLNLNGFSQVTETNSGLSLSFNESISHTGVNSGITLNLRQSRLEVYAGPEMALSDSYFRKDPRMGFTGGGKYYTNVAEKTSSYIFLNYQMIFYRPYLEDIYKSELFNRTSELTIGLGQEWKIFKGFHIGVNMGYGKYFDVFRDLQENKIVYFDDGTILLRFTTKFKL